MAKSNGKKSNRAKVRAYIFSVDSELKLVVVARGKEEAMARYVKDGGAEGTEPITTPARFAY